MGYTTDFSGSIAIDPPLNEAERAQLVAFAEDRHESIEFPGIWCQWVPTEDGAELVWDGGEKFYNAAAWMKYLVDTFLSGTHVLNGEIDAQGEDPEDRWRLYVVDNVVSMAWAEFVYGDPTEV